MVIDLDGVLWRGETLLPGVADFFSLLRERRIPFVLATNNATATLATVQAKLGAAGVEVSDKEVFTSAQAAAALLRKHFPQGGPVYAIGEAGLRAALTQAGFDLVDAADSAQAVVVGLDRQATWPQFTEAALAIQAGALFIGTNADATFPSERGLVPGAGALLAVLQTATGRAPTVIGKPEPHLFLQALDRLATRPEQTLVLGDRLETDILGGQRAGMATALVLTGVTRRADLTDASLKPDWVFDDLAQVCAALSGQRA